MLFKNIDIGLAYHVETSLCHDITTYTIYRGNPSSYSGSHCLTVKCRRIRRAISVSSIIFLNF